MGKRRSLLRARRPATCNGKVIYHSRKDADSAAGRARAKSGHTNIDRYKCPQASHYHIGHQHEDSEQRALANADNSEVSRESSRPKLPRLDNRGKTPSRCLGNVAGSLWASIAETED